LLDNYYELMSYIWSIRCENCLSGVERKSEPKIYLEILKRKA